MEQPSCYLAGPVVGCLELEAKDWRVWAEWALSHYGIRGISPIRSVEVDGQRYGLSERCPKHGIPKSIFAKNVFDVKRCDIVLAYLPLKEFNPRVGTISEIAWKYAWGGTSVLVSDDPAFTDHPDMQGQCGWITDSLETGVEIVGEILGAYLPEGVNL